jgi:hypothetical protein
MAQKTDLNVTPYYDDFSESDNFQRVLFKPSKAVQARELTQLQSIMQNQIERFGRHVFKEGSQVIPGALNFDNEYFALKLQSTYNSSAISTYLSSYVGKEITGATSGVKARVIASVAATTTDPETLYIKYIATGSDFSTTAFANGEDIQADAAVGSFGANTSSATTAATDAAATGTSVAITEGVYFVRGMFVRVAAQTLILDKYTNTPSYRVGFDIAESLVSDVDDGSLLDNAQGASNFAAQGADRLKVVLTLAKHTITGTTDTNFIELMRFEDGVLKSATRQPEYSEVMNMLARRTEEESGDYIVKPFAIEVKEHLDDGFNNGLYTSSAATPGDSTKFCTVIGPGKAYVSGFETERVSSSVVEFDKARTTATIDNETINADYGQYVRVTNVYGSPDITLNGTDTDPFKEIQLYNRQTATRGSTSGSHVGNARVRAFEYYGGTAGASSTNTTSKYNLHLFDINMFTDITMSANNSLTVNSLVTGGTTGATGFVVATTSGSTSFQLQGVVGRFTTGEAITSSTSSDTVSGTSSTVTLRKFNQDVKQVFGLYTVNAGEDFSADIDLDVNFTLTGSYSFANNDSITLEDSSGQLMQEDGAAGTEGLGDRLLGESVSTLIQTLNGELDEEIVVNDVIALPTGNNGALEQRRVTAVSGNLITMDSGYSSLVNDVAATRKRGEIKEPAAATLLFETSRSNTSTMLPSDTKHTIRRQYSGGSVITASGGVLTFNAPSGETFVTHSEKDYTLQIDALGSSTTGIAQGDIVSAGTGFVLSNSNQTITITNTNLGTNTAVKFIATLEITAATHKTKTRQKMATVTVTNNAASSGVYGHRVEDLEVSLGVADGYSAWAVYESGAIGTTPVTPTMVIASQTGVFVDGEQIVGNTSGAKALVVDHTGTTVKFAYQGDTLFTASDQITGQTNSYTAQVSSVTAGDPDVGYKYTFDSGMRDGFYDIARIRRRANQSAPTGQLLIVFDYFTHGAGNFFNVDSYTNQTDYDQIPAYENDSLSDYMDFRPRVADVSTSGSNNPFSFNVRKFEGTNSSQTLMPRPGNAMLADFKYYQGRCDYLLLTNTGKFVVVKGVPADEPVFPTNELPDTMVLGALTIYPYTISPDAVDIQIPSHRRWTMKDITGLSKRLKNLERTISLSLLEKKTENFRILDAEGFDRFKTGFLVDSFKDHGVANTQHPDYAGSVDRERGEFRPGLDVQTVELKEENTTDDERTADGYMKKGDMAMLPYTDEAMLQHSNKFATRQENLNPFSVTLWNGNVELDPESDLWIDTNRQAAFSVNVEGDWEAWQSWLGKDDNGQPRWSRDVWKSWQTDSVRMKAALNLSNKVTSKSSAVKGTRYRDTSTRNPNGSAAKGNLFAVRNDVKTTTSVTTSGTVKVQSFLNQSRQGERFDLETFRQNRSAGDETTMEVIPWMRERDVTVTATNMKPNTRVYAFFNERDVNAHVRPIGVSQTTTALTANVSKTDTTISVTSTAGFPDTGEITLSQIVAAVDGERTFDAGDLSPGSGDQHRWQNTSGTTYVSSETMTYSAKTSTTFTISSRGSKGTTITEHKSYTDPEPTSSTYNTTIYPTVSDSVNGQPLITDSMGQLACVFKIPNSDEMRFATGKGTFRLTDSSSNNRIAGTVFTSGEAMYNAFGQKQIKQERVNSLRNGKLIRTDLETKERTIKSNVGKGTDTTTGRVSTVEKDVFHGWRDPLAQTIRIEDPEFQDDGVFLTKVDVFFATKDTSTNPKPVTLQLRPVVNGYPAWEAIPGATVVLPASSVNTDDTAATATTFTFDYPIHLRSFTEYAVVLFSDSLDYNIWISRLTETDVGGTQLVSEQPYLGSLFKSQNASAWTTSQFEDLKFSLYRAKFDTTKTGHVYTVNQELDRRAGFVAKSDGKTKYLAKNPLETFSGSNKVKVKYYSHGMHSTLNNVVIRDVASEISDTTLNESGELSAADTTITLSSATNFASAGFIKIDNEVIQYTGKSGNNLTGCTRGSDSTTATTHEDGSVVKFYVFAGIPLTEINKTHTSISGVEFDSFEITTTTNASKTFTGGGSAALITKNISYDTFYPKVKVMEFTTATATTNAQVTSGMSLGSTQTPFSRTANADSFEVPLYENYLFGSPKVICSQVNETNELSGNKSLRFDTILTTDKDSVSPVIDLGTGQMGVICIANRINQVDSSSDVGTLSGSLSTFKDSKQPSGDNNVAIYITKEISLKQEATAIKTIFDATVQSGASLEVYYRIAQSNSETPFEEIEWVPFNTTGIPDVTTPLSLDINDFREYEYTAGKNDDVATTTLPLEGFGSFAIKIVMKSLNTAKPPILRDFRTMALAE